MEMQRMHNCAYERQLRVVSRMQVIERFAVFVCLTALVACQGKEIHAAKDFERKSKTREIAIDEISNAGFSFLEKRDNRVIYLVSTNFEKSWVSFSSIAYLSCEQVSENAVTECEYYED
jgi:hypothetical protein